MRKGQKVNRNLYLFLYLFIGGSTECFIINHNLKSPFIDICVVCDCV